jgi:site-specific DNA-methyltransferase (adenine-specific)
MKPTWERGNVRLYLGDCREVMPTLGRVDAVVTDPPYGISWDVGINPYGNVRASHGIKYAPIIGDDEPFDPRPLLKFGRCVLFGANHYADKLPPSGAWIVWDKRMHVASTDQSDCELAWSNIGNRAMMIRFLFHGGGSIGKENGIAAGQGVPVSLHPTQKPVEVMRRCVIAASSDGEIVCDPYMGSGTTGVAAVQTGRSFVGIEIDPTYFEIAVRRIDKAIDAGALFAPVPPAVRQENLFGGDA